jgi:hypothetical protein
VLAVSVPGLDVLKWVSSTELMPVFKYVKNGDYSDPKYDRIKFRLSLANDVLTLASKINPANTFTITGPRIPSDQLSFYYDRLPEPSGYNIGEINAKCSGFSTGSAIGITTDNFSEAKGRLTALTANNPLPSDVQLYLLDGNTSRIVTGEGNSQNALRACSNICDYNTSCKSFRFNQQSNGGFCHLYSDESTPLAKYTSPNDLGELCYNKKI